MGPELETSNRSRRGFLYLATAAGISIAGVGHADDDKDKNASKPAEEVSPPEDLMREHGVLKRVMLVYDEILRRMDSKQDFAPESLADAAGIIRHFIEDYHEKLEEDFLFPRFEKAGKQSDLTRILREQHQAGRRLTDTTLSLAKLKSLKEDSDRKQLGDSLRQFIRMY